MSSWRGCCSSFALVSLTAIAVLGFGCAENGSVAVFDGDARLVFVDFGICALGVNEGVEIAGVSVSASGERGESSFVRHGDALLIECAWEGGGEHSVEVETAQGGKAGLSATAPLAAGLAVLRVIELDPHFDSTAARPSSTAIDAGGRWCAVGTSGGDLLLFDLETGELAAKHYSAGAYIRSLEFAESWGKHLLLVGEQSPRGTISAFEYGDGEMRRLWAYDTSSELGSSLRDPANPYAWAYLPGIYRIILLEGKALVLAVHSAADPGTEKLSQLYSIDLASGEIEWVWPGGAPLPATATWIDADSEGGMIALCSYGSQGGGEIVALNGEGVEISRLAIGPLSPHLEKVNFWRSVAVSVDGTIGAMADDGRAWLWRPHAEDDAGLAELVLAEPIEVAGQPLLVSGAGVLAGRDGMVFATGVSYLPWHLSEGKRPQQPHPDALKLMAFTTEGSLAWVASIPNLLQGLVAGPAGRWLYTGYASDPGFASAGGNGVAVFDSSAPGNPLAASYPVEGGVMHGSPLASAGGRLVLLLEKALREASGEKALGANALHLLAW